MSYRPTNDSQSKLTSRAIDRFQGVHYGIAKEKQPNQFGAVCDLDMIEDKAELRAGSRKNETTGYGFTISSLFAIHIGGGDWVGSISNGQLQVQPGDDIIAGERKYYIWDEMTDQWTWDGVDAKTWDELTTDRLP